MKECTNCHETKPLVEFRRNKKAKDGHQQFCKLCASSKIKAAYTEKYSSNVQQKALTRHKKHQLFVNDMKREGCVLCEEKEPVCIDFHHIDPSQKEFEVSGRYGKSLNSIIQELKKCVCLCSNCHKKVHAGIINIA